MKRRSPDWLTLADGLVTIRTGGRVALRLVSKLESLLAPGSEAKALLAAVELKLLVVVETARRALKRRP